MQIPKEGAPRARDTASPGESVDGNFGTMGLCSEGRKSFNRGRWGRRGELPPAAWCYKGLGTERSPGARLGKETSLPSLEAHSPVTASQTRAIKYTP